MIMPDPIQNDVFSHLAFQEPILTAFGARVNGETFRLSKEYFFWITPGIPFHMFGQALNPIIRSDGSPRFAMLTLLIGAVLNILPDPICICVLRWGTAGAAIATILGQIGSAIMAAAYLLRMKAVTLRKDCFLFRPELIKFLAGMDKKPLPVNLLYQYTGFHSSQYSVGRRADQILKEYPNVLRVFITAPKPSRIRHISERDGLNENESAQKLSAVDKERAAYYNQSSEKRWASADSYDLCIDTEQLGMEGAADTILAAIAVMEQR